MVWHSKTRRTAALAAAAASLALLGGLPACGGGEKPTARSVTPVVRDVSPLLRGTIGAEATFRNVEPMLVSGYGLVVGLNGTGGDVLPDSIMATMEREMGLKGIGKAQTGTGTAVDGMTPRQMLRDPNVAVVFVQAAIPPGAPEGADFDVYVRAINATSLEGGQLWTTDLRLGVAQPFGGRQSRSIARSRGPIFINPFAEAGKEQQGVMRTVGRVLGGGEVTQPLGIELVLDNTSWQRARSIVSAINSRFPEGPGDDGPTARGRTGSSIELRVPNRYRNEPAAFLDLVKHIRISSVAPEETARRFAEGLKSEPALANELSWCLEAVGTKALPFLRDLYDYPEVFPRLAALKAGARLNDPLAATPLIKLARTGQASVRTDAITLLGRLDAGPSIDLALREFLGEEDLTVRIAAYEALAGRAERLQLARLSARAARLRERNLPAPTPTHLQVLAEQALPGNTMQGVERTPVAGKFLFDRVPVGSPLIYITQQGQPRIVLFGEGDMVRTPMVVSGFGDRLMMVADDPGAVRVLYRPQTSDRATTLTIRPNLEEMIRIFAHDTTPEDPRPGLGMSYSEVVGTLYSMQQASATRADFATERERLLAELQAASQNIQVADRPERPEDRDLVLIKPESDPTRPIAPDPATPTPKIVPIEPLPESKNN